MKHRIAATAAGVVALTVTAYVFGDRGTTPSTASVGAEHLGHAHNAERAANALESAVVLPREAELRLLLEAAAHNSEFLNLPAGKTRLMTFVSHPERSSKAPVLIVKAREGMTREVLALAFQASRRGFIGLTADYLTGLGPGRGDRDAFSTDADAIKALDGLDPTAVREKESAVRRLATSFETGNGAVVTVTLSEDEISVDIAGQEQAATFPRNDEGWARALTFAAASTGNDFDVLRLHDHVAMELRMQGGVVVASAQTAPAAPGQGRGASTPRSPYDWTLPLSENPGMTEKRDDLPASSMTADKVVATTPRRNEWIDIPVPNSPDKVHTWVVYPQANQPAGAIVVMHGGSGMTDWVRAIGDQLAKEGFIALVMDMASGLGPNGGNFDSFQFIADKMRATGRLSPDQRFARIKAVRDYAAKMPGSNGKTGSIGFCAGGTQSFQLATRVPEHAASVVYYGGAPPEEELAKTTAPVIGFYGENDPRILATVEPTRQAMRRLGKSYEAHTYPNVTHSFIQIQDLANNFQGTAASWPLAVQFLGKHLR